MQIKTTMRYHLTLVKWPLSKNLQTINAGKSVEKREPSYNVGGNVNWYSHYREQYEVSFKKKKKGTTTQCQEVNLGVCVCVHMHRISVPWPEIEPMPLAWILATGLPGKSPQSGVSQFSSVQFSRSVMSNSVTPRTAACQTSLSITNTQSLLKLMSIESVMPSNHLILYRPLLLLPSIFPASGSFPMSQFFQSGGQSIGASPLASVLPMNIQDWLPSGLIGWISLQSKGPSKVFSNTTVQKHQFFGAQLSL